MSNTPQNSPRFLLFLWLTYQNTSPASGDFSLSMTTQEKQKSEPETEKRSKGKGKRKGKRKRRKEKKGGFFLWSRTPSVVTRGVPPSFTPGMTQEDFVSCKPWVIPSLFMEKGGQEQPALGLWGMLEDNRKSLQEGISSQHFLAPVCAVWEGSDSVCIQN